MTAGRGVWYNHYLQRSVKPKKGYSTPPSKNTHTRSASALSGDDNRKPQWGCDCISALIRPLIAGDRQGSDSATSLLDAQASYSQRKRERKAGMGFRKLDLIRALTGVQIKPR